MDRSLFEVRERPQVVRKKDVRALLARYAVAEVGVIASVTYLTGLLYGEAPWSGWTAGTVYVVVALLLAVGIQVLSLCLKHYAAFPMQPLRRVLRNAAVAVTIAFSLLLSGLFLLKAATDYSRAAFLLQSIVVLAATFAVRALAHARIRAAIAGGRAEARRAMVFGDPDACAAADRPLAEAGVRIVGSLPVPPLSTLAARGEAGRAAQRRVVEACRAARVDDVVIMTKIADLAPSARLADFLSELPVSVHIVPTDAKAQLGSARLGEIGKLITVELVSPPMSATDALLKRGFDIAAASLGLILFSPLLVVVAVAIKLDSRGPVLFRQMRHGYNNEVFRVLKFRSMTTIEDGCAFTQAMRDDARVTRVGRVLRSTNIDELPQLVNVLRGEMSIVGPRPHPVAMNQNFEQQISPLSRRHKVRPGITGWAQVNGYRGQTDTLEKMRRRYECDIYYIDNWSFALDVKIILMTLFSKSAYTNAV
jgi:Undecaprenyl-phosphate glucose phosphotransferase